MLLFLRSLVFNVLFFGVAGSFAVLGSPLLLGPKRFQRRAMGWLARLLVWIMEKTCGIEVRVTGREHLPAEGAALIASKHQSAFDTLVWFAIVPDVTYVMKQELFRIPLYGAFARRAGMIGVDREGGAKAMRQMMREAQVSASEGRQIVIFPEGTRTTIGERNEWHPGIVALASATKLPVIPVATNSGRFWARHHFIKRPGVLVISILPPLVDVPRDRLLATLEEVIEAEQRLID
ncbi:lysophospholipid acyltransferase family protein [Sediminicoccus sp. BL-A-41-H5]|uniref:lysophospholipid acyltransferase family protein n=1 Tax=Sediminicoccus sp. BL-A-41-H5 TaxID=3421106 RepID=UPI003D679B5E